MGSSVLVAVTDFVAEGRRRWAENGVHDAGREGDLEGAHALGGNGRGSGVHGGE